MKNITTMQNALDELRRLTATACGGNVGSFYNDCQSYVSTIKRWIQTKLIPLNPKFSLSGDFLLYDGNRLKTVDFNAKNFMNVYAEGTSKLEVIAPMIIKTPRFPEGEKVITQFMVIYNTLAEIYEYASSIKQQTMQDDAREQTGIDENLRRFFASCLSRRNESNVKKEFSFGNGYSDKLLLGYAEAKDITASDVALAKERLGIDISPLTERSPSVYALTETQKAIVINCDSQGVLSQEATDLVENLVYQFIASAPVKKISIAGIECTSSMDSMLDVIISSARSLYYDKKNERYVHELLFAPIAKTSSDASAVISQIFKEGGWRKTNYARYSDREFSDIYSYNKRVTGNQDGIILLIINGYPNGFENRETQKQLLSLMQSGSSAGIYTIIINDVTCNNSGGEIDSDTVNFLQIDAVSPSTKTALVCGESLAYGANLFGMDKKSLAEEIRKQLLEDSTLTLDKIFDRISASNETYSASDAVLRIPIGNEHDQLFDFVTTTKNSPNGIILGGTGSGKTALLHTIILSGAYTYSPEDLEFYLADFKSSEGSGAFGNFEEGKCMYIPHVKYMSLKARPENTSDMMDMIESIHNARMKLISDNGFESVHEYNNSSAVKLGRTKKLSRIMFIIDEYAIMLSAKGKVKDNLAEFLKKIRTSGIAVVLCGQSDDALTESDIKQIRTRVLLSNYSVGLDFVDKNFKNKGAIKSFLTSHGKAAISLDAGMEYAFVNTAFSGEVGTPQMLALCEKIRKKYKNVKVEKQMIAGSEDIVNIDDDNRVKQMTVCDLAKGYSLYIGQSAMSYAPIAVRYGTEEKDNNYLLCAGADSVNAIKSNVILSFLYATALNKNKYSSYRVYDCWLGIGRETPVNCLEEYEREFPFISNNVCHVFDKYDVAKTISDVYGLYKGNGVDNPILLIVHGAGALKKGEINSDKGVTVSESQINEQIQKNALRFIEMSKAKGKEITMEQALAFAKTSVSSMKTQGMQTFDEMVIKEYLKELYQEGNLKNIFVLIAGSTYEPLSEYTKKNEKRYLLSAIASTADLTDNLSPEYVSTCCQIKSNRYVEVKRTDGKPLYVRDLVDSKVKLYDYTPNKNVAFWTEMKKIFKCEV